ncbi:D-alanine--D-alanine ligase family protein [Anaerobranca gottschalkii]|uniref:D-alanine--D-alanine ligase n=1 Tax=Anaerobranca gottschalkii DSM 13577 TaxID=1120990 RepID=A0A1H9Y497_9FIRM|nr:D-alanine--D-alanine ligase family protein [Anaerobranca gottschalkii]SES63178.1 D-alanine-D-alanine ligase [Anaerobranca gottschalkii DSM 13577]
MKNVAVIFGGRSGEHEVSLQSAKYIMDMIDRELYNVVPIKVTKEGEWFTDFKPISIRLFGQNRGFMVKGENGWEDLEIDVVFPCIHGTYGEDGCLQGLLEILNIPYVGSGVLGSAVGMDKGMMKRIFAQKGLPVGPYISFNNYQWQRDRESLIQEMEALGYPLFVKPANLGSSVGISKAKNREDLLKGVELALQYDIKIVVEKGLIARELECSVLGNNELFVSIVGEIVPGNEFYDYNAKYIDDNSKIIIPAEISLEVEREIQRLAKEAFRALDCYGLARVDFFYDNQGNIWLNEINTIPGFTRISMYPKLIEASGINGKELVMKLIELALERKEEIAKLRRDF